MMNPIFSMVMVVNDDAATLAETLDCILNQDFKNYEVIIIDNASTDGSDKICRNAVAGRENVFFKKLYSKLKNIEVWNKVFELVSGNYVLFLKGNDRFLTNALTELNPLIENQPADIVSFYSYFEENEKGNITFIDKAFSFSNWFDVKEDGSVTFNDRTFSEQRDEQFKEEKRDMVKSDNGQDAVKFLLNQQMNPFLGTKLFGVKFLADNGIRFDTHLDDDAAEIFFQSRCFFKAKQFVYLPNALYIAPKK